MALSASVRRVLPLALVAGAFLVLAPTPAHAAGLESVASALSTLFTGPILTSCATIGAVFVGYRFWTGHHEAVTSLIYWAAGCGIAFGALTFVNLIKQ